MEKKPPIFALNQREERKENPGTSDLQETLGRIDRILEAFYEIHGPLIKDQVNDQGPASP
jgi:hypothetical protein